MLLHDILNISLFVFAMILTINAWLIVGFIWVVLLENVKGEVEFKDVILMSFTWPLTVMIIISDRKQLSVKNK